MGRNWIGLWRTGRDRLPSNIFRPTVVSSGSLRLLDNESCMSRDDEYTAPLFFNNCQIVTTRKPLHFSGLGIPIDINLEFTTMIGKWAPTQNVPSITVPRLFKPNPSIFVSQLCRGLFIGAFSTLEKWDHLELCQKSDVQGVTLRQISQEIRRLAMHGYLELTAINQNTKHL